MVEKILKEDGGERDILELSSHIAQHNDDTRNKIQHLELLIKDLEEKKKRLSLVPKKSKRKKKKPKPTVKPPANNSSITNFNNDTVSFQTGIFPFIVLRLCAG